MTDFETRLKVDIEKEFPGHTAHKLVDADFWVVNNETGKLLLVIEGKGKGDTLKSHQSWYHDVLRKERIHVEVWYACGNSYIRKGVNNVSVV